MKISELLSPSDVTIDVAAANRLRNRELTAALREARDYREMYRALAIEQRLDSKLQRANWQTGVSYGG